MTNIKLILLVIFLAFTVNSKATDLGDDDCSSLLLVSNWANNNVKIFDGCSGDFIRDLDSQNLIRGPLGILEAPNGDVLVVSENNGRIISFDRGSLSEGSVILGDDPATTEVESNFISKPSGAIIGKDGFMYAASYGTNEIVKINTESWEVVDQILAPNNGLIRGIDAGIKISDDGHILAPGYDSSNILKINLTTKVKTTLVAPSTGGLTNPRTILIREQQNELWVSDQGANAVMVFNLNSGAFIKKLVEVSRPTGLMQDGEDHFLVNTADAVFRVTNDGLSYDKIVQNGAGNLSQGTFVYRLEKKNQDSDSDGLTNDEELNDYATDPENPDTDGDNLSDGDEINVHGSDPLNPDSDNDGMPDDFEVTNNLKVTENDAGEDLDNDGLSNLDEYLTGTLVNDEDTDGDGENDAVDADPLIPNSAPEISGTPVTTVDQDASYSFIPDVSYAGKLSSISYSIKNKPDWASFDQNNAELSGVPTNADVGISSGVIITATNGYYDAELMGFDVEVVNINDAPVVTTSIANQTLTIGDALSIDVSNHFNDIDVDDSLTYSATNLPNGISINSDGMISGTTTTVALSAVTVTAMDISGASVSSDFSINVQDEQKPTEEGGGGSSDWHFLLILCLAGLLMQKKLISKQYQ